MEKTDHPVRRCPWLPQRARLLSLKCRYIIGCGYNVLTVTLYGKYGKTGHLAWCALVALLTAREDGLVASESQENLFLTRWFARAKKQRWFSRDVATDIDWILSLGRTSGVHARLRHKLDYLWRSCTGELSEQSDLFRLICALEPAKQYGWVNLFLSDREWGGWRQVRPLASVNSICLLRSALDTCFNDEGTQVMPVPTRIGGRAEGLNALLKSCNWEAVSHDDRWTLLVTGAE